MQQTMRRNSGGEPRTIRFAGDGAGGMMKINPMAFGSGYSDVGSNASSSDLQARNLADAILI